MRCFFFLGRGRRFVVSFLKLSKKFPQAHLSVDLIFKRETRILPRERRKRSSPLASGFHSHLISLHNTKLICLVMKYAAVSSQRPRVCLHAFWNDGWARNQTRYTHHEYEPSQSSSWPSISFVTFLLDSLDDDQLASNKLVTVHFVYFTDQPCSLLCSHWA